MYTKYAAKVLYFFEMCKKTLKNQQKKYFSSYALAYVDFL